MGVDAAGNKDEGAGDQGIMFGFACRETPELMPAPIQLAHTILRRMAEARRAGAAPQLGPDAKSQVTPALWRAASRSARPRSWSPPSTRRSCRQDEVREMVRPFVLETLPEGWMCPENDFYVNPTGKFVIGGPDGDAGLTGRKIIVDTYGGAAPHGGGAFSGKDPTKVDRSAAYAARYLAKNVVAAGLAERCLIQLSYAIGVSKPLSVYVDTQGTGEVDPERLSAVLQRADGPVAARHPRAPAARQCHEPARSGPERFGRATPGGSCQPSLLATSLHRVVTIRSRAWSHNGCSFRQGTNVSASPPACRKD